MSIVENVQEVLHRIRVKLYPSYLPGTEGKYVGRTDDEASLSIEQVCAAAKTRGGFTGSYDDLVEHAKVYLNESAYQLADGFSVNFGYFSVHPKVGGLFDSTAAGNISGDHPITFAFRVLNPLRELVKYIGVFVEGLANVQGYIDEITDVSSEAVNEILTPGGMFSIEGHKLKVAGADAAVGIYFADTTDTSLRTKVTGNLAVNTSGKLVGLIPALAAGTYTVEVVTQYAGGEKTLKEPRTIASTQALTVA